MVMAKTLQKEVVCAIERDIRAAWNTNQYPDLQAIANTYSCSYQSVCYIRRRIEKLERTGVDERKKPGRKPVTEEEHIVSAIFDILASKPESSQRAVSDAIYEQFGRKLCQAAISRIYKKYGVPHKMTNKLYRNTKLFTTRPDGTTQERPIVEHAQPTYKSPYGPTDL